MNNFPVVKSKPHRFRKSISRLLWAFFASAVATVTQAASPLVWQFDQLELVGGNRPEVAGAPSVVDGAVIFDGARDGLFFATNPLAGAEQFTVEILFSPAEGGVAAQRFLHLEDEAGQRLLIETRLNGKGAWWLDTFLKDGAHELPLIDPARVHPTGQWYWASLRYDGKSMAHFVNGIKEREGAIAFRPMKAGRLSLGVRLNRVYWFKGAIRELRFTREALPDEKLQRVAPALAP